MSSHCTLLLAALSTVALANFEPLHFHHFAQDPQHETGKRRFVHAENHLLEDGTTFSLNWQADADPDTILGLDTEHKAGVRLASCMPNQLVLHLPPSHVGLAKAWKFIVASAELHGCEHLVDHPLYHRIEEKEFTKHHDTPKGGATIVFSTKELYSISQVIPNAQFSFGVTPIDSLHPSLQDDARRYADQMIADRLNFRRLNTSVIGLSNSSVITPATGPATGPSGSIFGDMMAGLSNQTGSALDGFKKGFKDSVGQITVTNSLSSDPSSSDSINNWKPMTHANFGWNWNYHTNATRNPQFKYTLPGMRGYVLLKNPYLKFKGGCNINFQSHWDEVNPFARPPRVKFNASLTGNAYVNADLSLMANVYRDVSEDPLGRFHIPLLNDFTEETHYFDVPAFFIASIPVKIQPGVSVNLNAYHLGLFKGAVRVGINTAIHVEATAKYDSSASQSIQTDFKAEALNVRILPPTWMIYTKHMEFGALLTPSFWVKGSIGPVKDVTLELQLRPYCNLSIIQEGQEAYGIQQQVEEKELVIMPFRAIFDATEVGSSWSVGIEANGRRIMTSTELALGVVEFNDYIQHFRFGLIDQRRLLHDPIYVALFKDGVRQEGQVVPIECDSVVEGECQPAPFNAMFTVNFKTVVVQLTLAWHARPVEYLLSKVRAMSVVFPQLALSKEASHDYIRDPPTATIIKITRNGREYRAYQRPNKVSADLVVIEPTQIQDLGINWIDAWRIQYGSISGQEAITNLIDPKIELIYVRNGQHVQVAGAYMPSIDWDNIFQQGHSSTGVSHNQPTNMLGDNADMHLLSGLFSGVGRLGNGAFGGAQGPGTGATAEIRNEEQSGSNPKEVWTSGFFQGNVPLSLNLATSTGATWASGHMGLDVHNVKGSNRWLRPYRTEKFVQGSQHSLYWTVHGADPGTAHTFTFIAFKVNSADGTFSDTEMKLSLNNIYCKTSLVTAQRFEGFGDECVFTQELHVDPGLVGVTIVFELLWRGHHDKATHKMLSAPVQFVASVAQTAQPKSLTQAQLANTPTGARKLEMEGGHMVSAPKGNPDGVEIPMASVPIDSDLLTSDEKHIEFKALEAPSKNLRADGRKLYGYTPSNISFQDKMAELHPICTRKPLHYAIGAGMFLRAKLHNFNVGDTKSLGFLGPLANMASMANLDTMMVPIVSTELGKKLSSLFPGQAGKGLCQQGICDGILPGCPGQIVHPMTIPKVEFKLNRALNWNATNKKEAQSVTAYGMALLPEFIRVTSIVLTSLLAGSTTPRPNQQDARYYHTGTVVYYNGHACRWVRNVECAESFEYRGVTYNGCSLEDHSNRGWCSVDPVFKGNWHNCHMMCNINGKEQQIDMPTNSKGIKGPVDTAPHGNAFTNALNTVTSALTGGRRLAEEDKKGQDQDQPAHESDRFLLEITPNASVPYKIDEDLIHGLIRRQAFRGLSDGRERELGVAKIVSFRLHHGEFTPKKDDSDMILVGPEEKFEVDFSPKAEPDSTERVTKANPMFFSFVAGAAVLCVAALAAIIHRVKRSSAQVQPYDVVETESEAGPIVE